MFGTFIFKKYSESERNPLSTIEIENRMTHFILLKITVTSVRFHLMSSRQARTDVGGNSSGKQSVKVLDKLEWTDV